MKILDQNIDLVNDQIQFHEKMASRFASNSFRQKKHLETASKFRLLLESISQAQKAMDEYESSMGHGTSSDAQTVHQLALKPEDVKGLPKELLNELSVGSADGTEFEIINLINEAGGMLTLDRILIGLYKKSGEVHKRVNLTSRLYRMGQKGLIVNVPNRKGLYATPQPTDEVPQPGSDLV